MSASPPQSSWISEQQALLALVVLSIFVALLVVLPYLQFVLLAFVLAYILYPLQERLEEHVTRMQAALTVTATTLLLILLPLVYLVALAVQEGIQVLRAIERGDIEAEMIEEWVAQFGVSVDLAELYEENREMIAAGLEQLALELFGVVRTLPRLFIGLTITLFVMFALLRDGDRFMEWLQVVVPVKNEVQSEFLERVDRLMWASIIGNVGASLIQAVALGIGLAVLGFDNIILLTIVTFILALLPLVGAFAVWVPLVVYLAALGQTTAAIALFFYGSLVSLSDFYTRPMVIGKSGALNSAIVVVGVFGGLVAFGAIGLFLGPVVVGGTKISLDLYARERAASRGTNPPDVTNKDGNLDPDIGEETDSDADDSSVGSSDQPAAENTDDVKEQSKGATNDSDSRSN